MYLEKNSILFIEWCQSRGILSRAGGVHQKWVQAYVVEKASHTTGALFCCCNLWYFKSPLISLGYYEGMRGNFLTFFTICMLIEWRFQMRYYKESWTSLGQRPESGKLGYSYLHFLHRLHYSTENWVLNNLIILSCDSPTGRNYKQERDLCREPHGLEN